MAAWVVSLITVPVKCKMMFLLTPCMWRTLTYTYQILTLEPHQPWTNSREMKLWGLQHTVSFTATLTCPLCDIDYGNDVFEVGTLVPQYSIHAHIILCRDATLRLNVALRRCCCSASLGASVIVSSTWTFVSKLPLPSLGLSLVSSERCWPLFLRSVPSPNSTQPSCSVSVFGCGREGNKSNNDRVDRYGDRWGKIINIRCLKKWWLI